MCDKHSLRECPSESDADRHPITGEDIYANYLKLIEDFKERQKKREDKT